MLFTQCELQLQCILIIGCHKVYPHKHAYVQIHNNYILNFLPSVTADTYVIRQVGRRHVDRPVILTVLHLHVPGNRQVLCIMLNLHLPSLIPSISFRKARDPHVKVQRI